MQAFVCQGCVKAETAIDQTCDGVFQGQIVEVVVSYDVN